MWAHEIAALDQEKQDAVVAEIARHPLRDRLIKQIQQSEPEPLATPQPVYEPFRQSEARYRLLLGGSGGGKSVAAAQWDLSRLLKPDRFFRLLVVRKIARTCRYSTFQAYLDILEAMGKMQGRDYQANKTEMTLTVGRNQILHAGLDDLSKVKSIAGARGLTHIRVEEADQLTYDREGRHDFDLLSLRLRGEQAEGFIFTLNPGTGFQYYMKRFGLRLSGGVDDFPPERAHAARGDVFAQHTTYLDNVYADHEAEARQYALLPDSVRTVYERGLYAETDAPDQLITYAMWKDALEAGAAPDEAVAAGGGHARLGVDVAWTGSDETALAYLDGYHLRRLDLYAGQDPTRTTGQTQTAIAEGRAEAGYTAVDDIGMGATVKSGLHAKGFAVQGFTAGARPVAWREPMPVAMKDTQFKNLRGQAWYHLRCLMEAGLLAISPAIAPATLDKLRADLLSVRYHYAGQTTVEIESKDAIRRRTGRSTDPGDALVMGLFAEYLAEVGKTFFFQ